MADDEVTASLSLLPLLKVWCCCRQLGVPKVGQRVPRVSHRGQQRPEAVGGGTLEGVASAQGGEEGEEEEEEEDDSGPPAEEADDEGQGDSAEDDGEEEEREAEAKTTEIWSRASLKLVKVEDGGEDGEEGDEDGGELDEGKVLLLLTAKLPPKQLKQETKVPLNLRT